MIRVALALCLTASVALGQTITVETLDPDSDPQIVIMQPDPELELFSLQRELGTVQSEVFVPAVKGTGAMLRGLDKLNGEVVDFELDNGFSIMFGGLRVDLGQCRHPEDNSTGEAYAFLTIQEGRESSVDPAFQGWMIASSPALNALDHARYDVWVLRCKTASSAEGN
ncbi:DUF2155 domain-containing protein [Shimia thalassica]|jgi:hypothetical protein|uniref:DUF2155 domain-containing protein n=1 Tax=Shimia thalassica TaxID=1715693 RepID=UPI001C09DC54|nr:DUF2155 domain-containing protein [Shimia thalassica]